MTILEELKQDHDHAKTLLKTIVEGDDDGARRDAFKEFATLISAHSKAEAEVLYKAMEKHEDAKFLALEGEEEHVIVDHLVESLQKSSNKSGKRWLARAKVLQELLEHHIEEEEGEVFEKAEKVFSSEKLEDMGGKFTERKKKLM